MLWSDEGYLISKNNYSENSIIIEAFTLKHGKYSGIVYGGQSRKQKKNFQIGNKILINFTSKGENRLGYFSVELLKAIAPLYFDDKKRSICILSAASILKILLPERQLNQSIYNSFESLINEFNSDNWINLYINWEISLIKDLGFESNFLNSNLYENGDDKSFESSRKLHKVPRIILEKDTIKSNNQEIKEALVFNKNLLIENFILPNKLKFPLFRNILEHYYT